jgi:hypothetical protein
VDKACAGRVRGTANVGKVLPLLQHPLRGLNLKKKVCQQSLNRGVGQTPETGEIQ